MKYLITLLLVTSFAFSQKYYIDTVRIAPADSTVTNYAAGDVVRSKAAALYRVKTGQAVQTYGKITAVHVDTDTANVANANFVVRFFNFPQTDTAGTYAGTNSDTTGYNILIAADNAAYGGKYQTIERFFVGDVATTALSYGSGSGATGARSVNQAANLPFVSNNGKLWVLLMANGALVPKQVGTYRIRIVFERYGL
jgi:hypothetical protein